MDLRHLRYAVRTAEEGNVTRAAERLSITQPALSRQLRALEADLGVVLFEKAGRGIALTDAGRELVPEFRDLLARAARLREQAAGAGGHERFRLDLIAPVQSIEAFLANALGRFAQTYPEASLTIREAPDDEVQGLLERSEGHIAVAAQPIGPQLPHRILAKGALHAALPKGHPLGGRKTLDVKELEGHPVLAMRRGTLSRYLLESALRLVHVSPDIRHESASPHALAAMARAGVGIAVLPITARTARAGLSFPALTSAGSPLSADIAVLWNPAVVITEPVEALFEMVAQEMRDAPFLEPVAKR